MRKQIDIQFEKNPYINTDNKVYLKYKAQIPLQMHFYSRTKAFFRVALNNFKSTKNIIINIYVIVTNFENENNFNNDGV